MIRRLLTSLGLSFLASGAASAAPSPPPQQHAKAPAAEKVLFFDDFSGGRLDRSKWNVITPDWVVNNEQQAYVDDGQTVRIVHGAEAAGAHDGALEIRAEYRPGSTTAAPGRTFDFTSGRLDTRGKFHFTYGTAAARIKMTAGAGLWPAFWLLGAGEWPQTGEIDVMENVGGAWVSSALHGPGYFGNTPLVKRTTLPRSDGVTAWHVYSVDWTSQELIFRIDGVERYRVTRAMVEAHGPWAFDNPKHLILNMALGGGYPQIVNKVARPYPGLPQSTVDLIKSGQARMLVDWVRVSQPAR